MLKGIFTPNLVPFLDDGRINEAELRRMINWLIEKGVNGLYPNGSTGEFIRLSFEERKRVIQIVAEETRGRVPVLTRLALDCPRIVGIKDSSRDFPRFLCTLQAIKPQRPDFACLIGCEEILFPSLFMGADGGTIATSGVVPEVIMKLYHEFIAG